MIVFVHGWSYRQTPLELREKLGFSEEAVARVLDDFSNRFRCEVVLLSTCNRIEFYIAHAGPSSEITPDRVTDYVATHHGLPASDLAKSCYTHHAEAAINHAFRVGASLDSLILGEGQIAGQVKEAYNLAQEAGTVGPILHALFQHGRLVAGRVRSETGISRGHVSVSSAAVDYVRQVFEHFGDKTVLIIGAGKMGELTLRHLRHLQPKMILVCNRSEDKAQAMADSCAGVVVPWDRLDDALTRADIVLSTTGAPEPIVSLERYERIRAQRLRGVQVILDIAVPRDFDPRIHDGDQACLFNVDDLKQVREQTLRERARHVAAAEAIVDYEQKHFLKDWQRRRNGAIIARLTSEFEAKSKPIVDHLLSRLNGRLTDADRVYIQGAFRRLQNQLLHGPISALTEEPHESHTLLEALRKLFWLDE